MERTQFSVAMCTYNGARYLREQLESVASQRLLPDEMVICDDDSSDETVQMLREFAGRAPFLVRLFVNDITLGATKNFEKAIGLCQMPIIVLCDQDDVWHPDKLECIDRVFRERPRSAAVFSDAELIGDDSHLLQGTLWESFSFTPHEQNLFNYGRGLQVLLKHRTVTGATMAFRQEYRDLVVPIPANHVHDSWISFLLASVSEIALIERPTIRYRRHAKQVCGLRQRETLREEFVSSLRADRSSYLPEVAQLEEVCTRLVERSDRFPCRTNAIPLIRAKIRHQRARAMPSSSWTSRLAIILREIATLGYWRYSKGFKSAAKDLFVCFVPQW